MTRGSRTIHAHKKPVFKTVTIYLLTVVLAGFALSGVIQGIMVQLSGNTGNASLLYMTGLGSLLASIAVYNKGKEIIGKK